MRPETRRDRLCVLRLAPSQSAKVQRVTERRSSAWSVEEWVPGFGSMPAMSQTSGPTRTVRLLFIVANLTAAGNGKDTSLQLQRIPASSCGGILPAGTKQQSFEWPVASTSSSGWDTFIESNDAPSISRQVGSIPGSILAVLTPGTWWVSQTVDRQTRTRSSKMRMHSRKDSLASVS